MARTITLIMSGDELGSLRRANQIRESAEKLRRTTRGATEIRYSPGTDIDLQARLGNARGMNKALSDDGRVSRASGVLLSIFLALSALGLSGCVATPAAHAQERSIRSEPLVISLHGSCLRADGGFVDLGRAMFLQNPAIDVQFGSERRRLEISGQTLYIDAPWSNPASRRWIEIYSEVQWSDSPPDIELTFVYVEGELALHWQETYQHRQVHQGLLHVDIDGVRKWCDGIGGVSN